MDVVLRQIVNYITLLWLAALPIDSAVAKCKFKIDANNLDTLKVGFTSDNKLIHLYSKAYDIKRCKMWAETPKDRSDCKERASWKGEISAVEAFNPINDKFELLLKRPKKRYYSCSEIEGHLTKEGANLRPVNLKKFPLKFNGNTYKFSWENSKCQLSEQKFFCNKRGYGNWDVYILHPVKGKKKISWHVNYDSEEIPLVLTGYYKTNKESVVIIEMTGQTSFEGESSPFSSLVGANLRIGFKK